MTTLVLQAANSVVGGVASTATSLAGRAVASLFAGGQDRAADTVRVTEGPRLHDMPGLASSEGAAIPRVYGRARIGGQLIWATRFEEVVHTTTTTDRASPSRGSKGGGSSRAATTTTVSTTYSYLGNFAVGLCEGPIAYVRRVWADGREVDLTALTMRVHLGTEDQPPDPLIVAKEGEDVAPAYRGLAYVVFERMPLAAYGNRLPQLSFEVVRPPGGLRQMIRSVCLIPGATEFGYDTQPVARILGLGASTPENVHQFARPSDVAASLDALQALCPNLAHVSLVVSWFGDDLRAGHCTIAPRVDLGAKSVTGQDWSVAGLVRGTARETSRVDGVAAYGGTPSDASLVRLIGELKGRGLAVTLYPFVMMDVPAANGLADPWSGAGDQPAYPWRGRITCDPAPGRAGTADGTAAAAAQVAALFGTAAPANFSVSGGAVGYSGPAEWSYRRLVLHCAALAVAAGGVESFMIGSELVGLTRVRSASGIYPAVAALRTLAADVRSMLGPSTKLTYGADWTEYGAHVLGGGQEVRFPLDPLWADPAIDAVGIDWYPPLSDWRDTPGHLDEADGQSPYDRDYLRARVGSGEAFGWFYASEADRAAQVRTPISDGAYAKPWTFRAKDLVGWWSNPHVERVGGIETAATAWVARSKPIWLTELGVPAVDKGPNGPNVFPDPKSSESGLPPFSDGSRDDLAQVRGLEATLARFDPALPGHDPSGNPLSPIYAGHMVDPARAAVWCWDARPFPAFPDFAGVWADGANWATGHWITGRIEGAPIDRLVSAILADNGLDPGGTEALDGFVDGYVIDRPMSARDALEPLSRLFGFDALSESGEVRWRGRGGRVDRVLAAADLVEADRTPTLSRSRAQETDLPASIELGFTDAEGEYGRAAAGSRRLVGSSRRELAVDVAAVTTRAEAKRLAEIRLQDSWAGRETAEFAVSPRDLALEPGDVVELDTGGGPHLHRVVRIVDGEVRRVSARAVEPALFRASAGASAPGRPRTPPPLAGPPVAVVLDLPASPENPDTLQHLAVAADPWPGGIAVWRSADGASFTPVAVAPTPSIIGRTLTAFGPGPAWFWDEATTVDVELSGGSLATVTAAAALAGDTPLAIRGTDGAWEVVSVRSAVLIGPRRYRLSGLLRGLGGTERLTSRAVPAGATVVRLDGTLVPLSTSLADLGTAWAYRAGPAGRDHSDPAFVQFTATVGPTALRPLAPVQLRAHRGTGGVALSWIRRTRLDGDGWDLADVPLGEEQESYALDILDGAGAVRRSLATSAAGIVYGAADEISDFGSPQTQLSLRVAQLSRTAGRGFETARTLPVL